MLKLRTTKSSVLFILFSVFFLIGKVSADSNSQNLESGGKSAYISYLELLDQEDPKVIQIAHERLIHSYSKLNQQDKNELYMEFVRFIGQVANKQREVMFKRNPNWRDDGPSYLELNEYGKEVLGPGLEIQTCEGHPSIQENAFYVPKASKGFVGSKHQRFLELRSKEVDKSLVGCEGFTEISYEEVFKRLSDWEQFKVENPDFRIINKVDNYIEDYVEWLIDGHTYEHHVTFGSTLLPRIQRLFEVYIASKPYTDAKKKLETHYNSLRANGFQVR